MLWWSCVGRSEDRAVRNPTPQRARHLAVAPPGQEERLASGVRARAEQCGRSGVGPE